MAPQLDGIILLHATTSPLTLGFLRRQVGYMKGKGLQVHVLASPGPALGEFGAAEGVPVHAVEMPRRITPLRDLVSLWQFTSALRRLRPTIVHAHTPKAGVMGMVAAWLARVPVRVYHIHGMPYLSARGWRRWLLRLTEKTACRHAHQVLCVSPSVRQAAIEDGVCPAGKCKVLLSGSINGLEARTRFNPELLDPDAREQARAVHGIPAEAFVVGFVGRIVRDKGLVELTEAWQALREENPALHLLVIGEFEPQDPVPPEVVAVLQNDPRIHLTGWVAPEQMSAMYAAMDLVALPSYREGFPYVPLEASAMALPVIATDVPGCVDAVQDGLTGMLVPAYDGAALAEAIRRYLADPALRQQHGAAGRERILRDFQPEPLWEATYQEYVRLLREKRLPTPEDAEL